MRVEGNGPTAAHQTGGDGLARFDLDGDLVVVVGRLCATWTEEPNQCRQQQLSYEESPVLYGGCRHDWDDCTARPRAVVFYMLGPRLIRAS